MITLESPLAEWIYLLGRVCIASVFLVSGIHKLFWYRKAEEEFRVDGVPLVPVTLPATIALHTFASIAIILGVFVVEAALALAIFTIAATIKVHHFWTMQGEQRLIISRVAMANLAVVGGLLVLAVMGSEALP